MLMDVKNISVHLNNHLIVKDVSLNVKQGELVGVIGPNGAGKTTLLKSLAKLLPVQSGTIEFQGKVLSEIDQKMLSRSLSYMAQGDHIHWPLKVEKLVELGRLPYVGPWQSLSQKDIDIIEKSMDIAEVSHLRHRVSTKLSGGERRLVMLARAIAVEPEILLADEPVSGLDPNHQIQVMKLLHKMTKDHKSIVMVLHDLSLAARYCHKLYLMKDGKILISGTPKEVLTEKNLQKAYGITAKYGKDDKEFYVVPWDRV